MWHCAVDLIHSLVKIYCFQTRQNASNGYFYIFANELLNILYSSSYIVVCWESICNQLANTRFQIPINIQMMLKIRVIYHSNCFVISVQDDDETIQQLTWPN